jgi:type IV pilus biogenesis protein CpaD/CtpE
MNSLSKKLPVLLLAALAAALAGCTTNAPKQSSIPWAQPQSWEGQIPGMSQPISR